MARVAPSETKARAAAHMKILSSSEAQRVRNIKLGFVVDVYLGRGDFWKGVKAARMVHDVEAKEGLPLPMQTLALCLAQDLMRLSSGSPFLALRGLQLKMLQSWSRSIRAVWLSAVPQEFWQATDWDAFAAACILWEPPELKLDEFADYGGLALKGAVERMNRGGPREVALIEFYEGLIEELGKRDFESRGEDVRQAVSKIYTETDLLEKLKTRVTEVENLGVARNLGGRPQIIESLAIKCAALYHDHNGPAEDPADKRFKRWTYESLAKKIIFPHPNYSRSQSRKSPKDVGARYVKRGEELRDEHRKKLIDLERVEELRKKHRKKFRRES